MVQRCLWKCFAKGHTRVFQRHPRHFPEPQKDCSGRSWTWRRWRQSAASSTVSRSDVSWTAPRQKSGTAVYWVRKHCVHSSLWLLLLRREKGKQMTASWVARVPNLQRKSEIEANWLSTLAKEVTLPKQLLMYCRAWSVCTRTILQENNFETSSSNEESAVRSDAAPLIEWMDVVEAVKEGEDGKLLAFFIVLHRCASREAAD